MKKLLLLTSALTLLTGSAFAADMRARPYTKAPPPEAAPIYQWTGFYIGGHVGGAFRDGNNSFGFDNDGRFIAGGQVGADYQFSGQFLIGIEGQYSYVDRGNNNGFAFAGGNFNHRLDGLASVTGRLGYTFGPGLIYAKGGYAYADTRNNGFGPFSANNDRDGYTVGGGIEYMFAQNFSAKIEYQYFDFGRQTLFTGAPLINRGSFDDDLHTIKLGVNYRFNSLNPLAPRY